MSASHWPFLAAVLVLAGLVPPASARAEAPVLKPAIVLAAFGTTEPEALSAILNVEKRVRAAFPDHEVRLGFTANLIRNTWQARGRDKDWLAANPGLPAEIYEVVNPLAALALIQDKGPRPIFVQSLHIVNGTEFENQKALTSGLAKLAAFPEAKKPFPYLSLGDSALGQATAKDFDRAAEALKSLVDEAKGKGAALVLFGHGNDHKDIKAYRDFNAHLAKKYAPQPVYMVLVEGQPGFDDLLAEVKKAQVKKTLLAPFMLVAGDHAINDMAGEEPDSLASLLRGAGVEVEARLKGLGDENAWADIYVERLRAQAQAYEKAVP